MMIRRLSRSLSFLSAFFGAWTLIRSPKGVPGGFVWLPKLWAGAWAPFLSIAGALGALLGLATGDKTAFWIGFFGAAAGYKHTVKVTRPHDAFVQAFGIDWEQRLSPDLWVRQRRPYQLIQPLGPLPSGERNVSLGGWAVDGKPLLCDIWTPPAAVPRSGLAVIYLHGSLWQALDKDFLTRPLFERLAAQGHVVMDLAYSLAPEAGLPQMVGEVKQAISWMKSHAAARRLDPERVVLMGASGGGHLALLAAYTPNHPAFQAQEIKTDTSVRAAVSLYGITDLAAFFDEYGRSNPKQPAYAAHASDALRPRIHDRTVLDNMLTRSRMLPAYRYSNLPGGPLLLIDLLGGTVNEVPEVYRLYSPLTHVGPHCPPTLQIFGGDDFVIDASQGWRLHRALREAGIPSVYVEFPDTVHGFDQYFGVSRRVAPAAQMATNDIERFLALMAS
jgi:acetyl esterase/lipase